MLQCCMCSLVVLAVYSNTQIRVTKRKARGLNLTFGFLCFYQHSCQLLRLSPQKCRTTKIIFRTKICETDGEGVGGRSAATKDSARITFIFILLLFFFIIIIIIGLLFSLKFLAGNVPVCPKGCDTHPTAQSRD